MNTEETLIYLIDLLLFYLEELKDEKDIPSEQFAYGEKTAYTECLEVLQLWKHSKRHGLDFNIETKYPL
ncbi:MAG: hypothetical protein NC311_15165 [Muribaculaceae bacterium]|nr:hypothetical protein [Muribaculaceae bacterium]